MFQRLLKKISFQLKKASIPYMVIGGQAVLLYGEPRDRIEGHIFICQLMELGGIHKKVGPVINLLSK